MALACAAPPARPGYRAPHLGAAAADDLRTRYREFFAGLEAPDSQRELDLAELRRNLEQEPVGASNYDALNAIAIGYFALNARAEADRGGPNYLSDSYAAAKLVAVPWRAYGIVSEPALRDAILDFFEDVASGRERYSVATASRMAPIVRSLEAKEADPERSARIRAIAARLER